MSCNAVSSLLLFKKYNRKKIKKFNYVLLQYYDFIFLYYMIDKIFRL